MSLLFLSQLWIFTWLPSWRKCPPYEGWVQVCTRHDDSTSSEPGRRSSLPHRPTRSHTLSPSLARSRSHLAWPANLQGSARPHLPVTQATHPSSCRSLSLLTSHCLTTPELLFTSAAIARRPLPWLPGNGRLLSSHHHHPAAHSQAPLDRTRPLAAIHPPPHRPLRCTWLFNIPPLRPLLLLSTDSTIHLLHRHLHHPFS